MEQEREQEQASCDNPWLHFHIKVKTTRRLQDEKLAVRSEKPWAPTLKKKKKL